MLIFLLRFARVRGGNVAMIVALALPAIFLLIGGVIDFGRMVQLRMMMQDAADVASVGSVAINSKAYKAGLSMSQGEIPVGATQAVSIFNSDMHPQKELSHIVISAQVMREATRMTSSVTVHANYKPYILQLFGFNHLSLGVTSNSLATLPPFIDFYLLLDNSPSMGVGATTADINKMKTNTPSWKYGSDANCAFACHQKDKPGTDFYALA